MDCKLVEERLSAYLDDMLAPAERRDVAVHLQSCSRCMTLLAELRQNDILLARLPRVTPSLALRERLFAMPELREFVEALSAPGQVAPASNYDRVFTPVSQETREAGGRPRLISPPVDRVSVPWSPMPVEEVSPIPPATRPSPDAPAPRSSRPRLQKRLFTPLKIAIAAALIVALGTASLLGLSFRQQTNSASLPGAITPPAAPATGSQVPLAAGSRFVFLRAGTLWSTLADGSNRQPERLTPANVTVAPGWMVNPAQGSHTAGALLAYVDLQSAEVHTIRSDGQQDTPVHQALFKTASATSWDSTEGQTILNSLTWSPDGSSLAFIGDPTGAGLTNLYLYALSTNAVRMVATTLKGSASSPVWSPDGTRLAFTLAHNGAVNIMDYNIRSKETLSLSNLAESQGSSANRVLTLAWSASASAPAITWSLGTVGRISSIWLHRVGSGGTTYPQRLVSGDYLQALYSPRVHNNAGGWLLVATVAGRASDIWYLELTASSRLVPLSQGKQVSFARWSPDGTTIFYLDRLDNGLGRGHLVNMASGADQLISTQVAVNPAPAWSAGGQQLAYSTGTQITIVSTQKNNQALPLHLSGQITNFSWSPASPHQLLVVMGNPAPGIYLVDTRHNSSLQLDRAGTTSAVQWTEIP